MVKTCGNHNLLKDAGAIFGADDHGIHPLQSIVLASVISVQRKQSRDCGPRLGIFLG
jgi:hypothetical protein